MNKSVAEAARRIFGNLPHSKGRSGNKVLRKNMIGHKIAEVRHSSKGVQQVNFEHFVRSQPSTMLRAVGSTCLVHVYES